MFEAIRIRVGLVRAVVLADSGVVAQPSTDGTAEQMPSIRTGGRFADVRARLVRASIAGLLALIVTFGAHVSDGRAASPPKYVALGDSYTADPSVSAQAPGSPSKCERSAKNYPHLVAAALGLELTDVSCDGADVGDLQRSQLHGVPPQFQALTPATQVVTVGIGGDDGNLFASLLNDCAEASLHPRQAGGAPCGRGGAKLPRSAAADEPHLSGAYAHIHELAPGAKVFVVGYPDVFTAHGACPKVLPFTRAANAFANSTEKDLNKAVKQAAEANGDVYVDTYSSSVTRNSCASPAVRWIEPFVTAPNVFPMHPNARGVAGVAGLVEQAMQASGIQ